MLSPRLATNARRLPPRNIGGESNLQRSPVALIFKRMLLLWRSHRSIYRRVYSATSCHGVSGEALDYSLCRTKLLPTLLPQKTTGLKITCRHFVVVVAVVALKLNSGGVVAAVRFTSAPASPSSGIKVELLQSPVVGTTMHQERRPSSPNCEVVQKGRTGGREDGGGRV